MEYEISPNILKNEFAFTPRKRSKIRNAATNKVTIKSTRDLEANGKICKK